LQLYTPAAEKLGWEYASDEGFLTTQLRTLIISAAAGAGHAQTIQEAQSRFQDYFKNDKKDAIHPAAKLAVFRISISEGGKEEYEYVWNEYLQVASPDGKEITLQALGRSKNLENIKDYLSKMISEHIPTQNTHYVSSSLSINNEAKPHLWEFVKEKWDDIHKLLSGNMVLLDRFVRVSLNKFADEKTLQEMTEFFEGKDQRGYDRAVRVAIDTVQGNITWKNRDEKILEEWLQAKGYMG